MNIKTKDTVIVLSGKDKGVKGEVLAAMPGENKLIVKGVNMATVHQKARKQGEEYSPPLCSQRWRGRGWGCKIKGIK